MYPPRTENAPRGAPNKKSGSSCALAGKTMAATAIEVRTNRLSIRLPLECFARPVPQKRAVFSTTYVPNASSSEDISRDSPKLARETGLRQYRTHDLRGLGLPVWVESVSVPQFAELPRESHRHREAKVHVASLAPFPGSFFRPEEKNRGSGVADVVPEPPRRDDEVDYGLGVAFEELTFAKRNLESIAALGAARGNPCVELEE